LEFNNLEAEMINWKQFWIPFMASLAILATVYGSKILTSNPAIAPQAKDLCSNMPTGASQGLTPATFFWQGTNGYQIGCNGYYSNGEIRVDISKFGQPDMALAAIKSLGDDTQPHITMKDLGDTSYEYKDPAVSGYAVYWSRNCYVGYVVTSNLELAAQAMQLARQADEAMKKMGPCEACLHTQTHTGSGYIRIISITGDPTFRDASVILANDCEIDATVGMELYESDRVRTGYKTEMMLDFDGKATVMVEEVTEFKIGLFRLGEVNQMELWLKMGQVTAQVYKKEFRPTRFTVKNPTLTASVRGTIFRITYDEATQTSTLQVSEGSVDGTPENTVLAPFVLEAGQQVTVSREAVGTVTAYSQSPGVASEPIPSRPGLMSSRTLLISGTLVMVGLFVIIIGLVILGLKRDKPILLTLAVLLLLVGICLVGMAGAEIYYQF
jgi:hypothetical protein